MAAVIRWEEPPPKPTGRGAPAGARRESRHVQVAEELRARPGEWAVVFEGPAGHAGGLVSHIRYGQVIPFAPSGDFDATSRTRAGITTVYARYLGDGGCE